MRLLHEAGAPPREPFAGIRAAGPIASERWDDVGEGPLATLRAERWTYGDDDKQSVELSLQAKDLTAGKQCRDALLDDLARRGLTPDPPGSPRQRVLMDLLLVPNHAW